MGWVSSLFGSKTKSQKEDPTTFTLRQGRSVPVDDAFRAWTSGDLNLMLKAVATKTNPIDRHFLLQSIVSETYKLRKEEKYRELCIEYAEKHLQEFPSLAPALKEDMGGTLPRISTFQHYAMVLTESGEYEKAISICEQAIKYDLHDNTNSGFEGRIARIRKKAGKENA
jgi:tetratricopeptide (TPR) repeat protein